jgi:hypothetical protein
MAVFVGFGWQSGSAAAFAFGRVNRRGYGYGQLIDRFMELAGS